MTAGTNNILFLALVGVITVSMVAFIFIEGKRLLKRRQENHPTE